MTRDRNLRIVLGLLLAVAAATQILATRDAFRVEWRPIGLGSSGSTLARVAPEAQASGLAVGDHLVTIDRRPIVGRKDFEAALRAAVTRDRVEIVAESPAGERKQVTVLAPPRSTGFGGELWALAIVLSGFLPAICLALGFWVAFARPADARAWLLLGLLGGFSSLVNVDTSLWPPVLREAGAAWRVLLKETWPLWMMGFGLTFPRPFERIRRWRWVLAALTTVFALNAVVRAVITVVGIHDLQAAQALERPLLPLGPGFALLSFAAIGSFFWSLGLKSGKLRDPDDRRRLTLLWAGASIAMGPLFVTILIVLVTGGGNLGAGPRWLLIPSLLLLPLLPLTLAYVIVVQRAMDVRVVLRLGVQYALARRGGLVLLGATGAGLAYLLSRLFVRDDLGLVGRVLIAAVYFSMLVTIFRTSRRFKKWVDRKFFRDAYDAELILNELAEQVGTIVNRGELLDTVVRKIGAALHVPRLAVLVPEGSRLHVIHASGFPAGFSAELPSDGSVARRLAASGAPASVWLDDVGSWLRKEGAAPAELAALRTLDARLLVPAVVQGRLAGVLSLAPKLSEEPFSIVDQRLLRTVAAQTALALEHARLTERIVEEARRSERLQRDVEIAREVQESLFPKDVPEVPGVEVAGACRPAQGVGGDYFDFLQLPGGKFGVCIADVSGKGIAAALLMSALQASLRGQALHPELDLAALMAHVNRLVHDASPSNRYATFFYAQYDSATRRLDFVNAGHNPPIVLRRCGDTMETIRLKCCGTVVGLFADSAWKHDTIVLAPGDLFVGFTDGISEAMSCEDEEWGEERMIATLRECDALSAAQVIPRVMAAADAFVAGAPQHDDMTLIVVRVAG